MAPASVVGVGIGAAIAAGNFLLSLLTAKLASTRSVGSAMGVALVSMIVRLAALAVFFLILLKSGHRFLPMLVSFVFVYTVLMGVEVMLLNRERS